MKIVNIDWDVNRDDIVSIMETETPNSIAEKLNIGLDEYNAISDKESYIYDAYRHNRVSSAMLYNLPDEVEIDIDEWSREREEDWNSLSDVDKDEDIANYLSDTYGFYVNNWEYEMN